MSLHDSFSLIVVEPGLRAVAPVEGGFCILAGLLNIASSCNGTGIEGGQAILSRSAQFSHGLTGIGITGRCEAKGKILSKYFLFFSKSDLQIGLDSEGVRE